MTFQVSPGVQVKEIDLTNVVPAVSSTTGAFAGSFQWGPVDEVVTVSGSSKLEQTFGKPSNTDIGAEDWYTAEGFLRYGSSLRVVRPSSTSLSSANAAAHASSIIKNGSEYVSTYRDGSQNGTVGKWTSKYAGALGNSLKVSVCGSADAYYKDNQGNTSGDLSAGSTSITGVTNASTLFLVRDIITFDGHNTQYRVTAAAGTTLTIEALGQPAGTGLTTPVDGSGSAVNINRYWEFHSYFDKKPETSAVATAAGTTNDEIHVVVVDEDGLFSGVANTVLETYGFVSLASDGKGADGTSNYYRNVIESKSEYVYWSGHATTMLTTASEHRTLAVSIGTAFGRPSLPENSSLSGGNNGNHTTAAQKTAAWTTFFADSETVDISFLIVGSSRTDNGSGVIQDLLTDWTTLTNPAILLTESRKDCIAYISPRRADVVGVTSESTQSSNVKTTADTATSSSYAVIDSGWVYIYDRHNDKYCWVPANGHTAGLSARSDVLRDAWYSPAGFSRGQYLGVTKLAFNPSQSSRDDLYRARVNPVVTFAGQGTVLFGDKTALTSPSAFDRINVRRLFIVLEKAIATAAKAQLFEFNDAFTRAQFRSSVEPFLRDVKNRNGVIDYSVVCDETNNTDTVIDRNEFVCSIFVKPARSINYITLNFVAARSGVQFEEIYGAI
jgi:hypothetical protein